jgi:hypothetical protein
VLFQSLFHTVSFVGFPDCLNIRQVALPARCQLVLNQVPRRNNLYGNAIQHELRPVTPRLFEINTVNRLQKVGSRRWMADLEDRRGLVAKVRGSVARGAPNSANA